MMIIKYFTNLEHLQEGVLLIPRKNIIITNSI